MKPSEFRTMTVDEIKAKTNDLRKELFNLRFQAATGEIQDPARIKKLRKDIARALTIEAQKKVVKNA